ncbi:cell wall protein [Colletotrichum tofieldiae]|nr:cell wall protein [Colletotrichum tofieldiae]GKT68660.1 cell wall protein [Colletotrichum tofieldiae]
MQKAQVDIGSSQPLATVEAGSLQPVIDELVMAFQKLVTDITDKKPIFDQVQASPGTLQFLQQTKSASTSLGQAIISKVPDIKQQSVDQIIAALDRGI